jgi:hypothetical protein
MINGDIVQDTYEELGLIALAKPVSSDQMTQGLKALRRLYLSIANINIGYPWIDVVGESGYVYGADERVTRATAFTMTLPDYVEFDGTGSADSYDEDTLRRPLDGDRVQVITLSPAATQLYLYRADLAAWKEVTEVQSDESPFNEAMDRYLIAMLAEELSGKVAGTLTDRTASVAAEGRFIFRQKYRRPSPVLEAEYF